MRLGIVGWMIGVVVVCVALTSLIKTVTNPWGKRARAPTAQVTTGQSDPISKSEIQPVLSPRDQYLQTSRLVTEAKLDSEKALDDIATWNAEILPMLEQREGDNVAADPDLVEKLAYVINKKRMTKEDLQAGIVQIEQISKRVDELSTSDAPELLSTSEINLIRELYSDAKIAANSWDRAVKRATAIIRQSKREPAPGHEVSLQDKVDEANDRQVLADLSEEQVNGPPPEEAHGIVSNGIFPTSLDPRLRDSALSAEVITVLAPFLEKRNVQPRLSGRVIRFQNTIDPAPMSLSRLVSLGALNDSVDGLKRLVAVGANRDLSEPKWNIQLMPNNWSEDDRELLKSAQEMLRDYGSVLVSEGLLSK